MIAHITYLSEKSMHEKFGRRLQNAELFSFKFDTEFMVESYLHNKGMKFVNRFDANSYLYITKAIDYFDLKYDYGGSLTTAFEHVTSDFLIIGFTTDWLYPSVQSREIVNALRVAGKNVVFAEIDTDKGHDAFLLPNERMEKDIANFLKREFEKINRDRCDRIRRRINTDWKILLSTERRTTLSLKKFRRSHASWTWDAVTAASWRNWAASPENRRLRRRNITRRSEHLCGEGTLRVPGRRGRRPCRVS